MNKLTLTTQSFVAPQTIISFDYIKKDSKTQERRALLVTESNATHISGFDFFRSGEFRKFNRGSIRSDIEVWGMLTPLPGTA